jgi:homoserine kinase type II
LDIDLTRLEAAWPVPGPWTVRPVDLGFNNLTRVVGTPAGDFILRVYEAHSRSDRVRHEHAVLLALQGAELPFALPVPVAVRSGGTFVDLSGDGRGPLASLVPLLPGSSPAGPSLPLARSAGESLARLVQAMGVIDAGPVPAGYPLMRDLHLVHEAAPDPMAALDSLPLGQSQRRRLTRLAERVLADLPALYGALPAQVVHRDYHPRNALVEGEGISAILDFELAARDLRAVDFAVGLTWWPLLWGTEPTWEPMEAFARGYFSVTDLTPAEIEAIPLLNRLRWIFLLVYFIGRYRQGLDSWERILPWLIERTVLHDLWLRRSGSQLVERVHQWQRLSRQAGNG